MKELDYVVAQMKDSKPFLAQIKEINSDGFVVIPDTLRYRDLRTVEITKRDILVRLGKEPKPGKVYGVDVSNVYRKSILHDVWGSIHFFVKPTKEQMKMLKLALDFTAKKLDKEGLLNYTDRFQTEIRAKKGKYAGMYQHSKEDGKSLVWYAPECAPDQKAMNGIIFHEYGHVLRFHGLTRVKPRARWQRLFQQSVAPVIVSKKWLADLLAAIKAEGESERSLGSIIKEVQGDDDEAAAYVKALSRWMRQIHHAGPRDLEVLWQARDLATLESLWPSSSIDTSKLKPIISEYATKNVEECWAESFMFRMLGAKLPSHVDSLLDKSLTIIKDGS